MTDWEYPPRPPITIRGIHLHRDAQIVVDPAARRVEIDGTDRFNAVAFVVLHSPTDLSVDPADIEQIGIHGIVFSKQEATEWIREQLVAGADEGRSLCVDVVNRDEGRRRVVHFEYLKVAGLEAKIVGTGPPENPYEIRFRGWAEPVNGVFLGCRPGVELPEPAT